MREKWYVRRLIKAGACGTWIDKARRAKSAQSLFRLAIQRGESGFILSHFVGPATRRQLAKKNSCYICGEGDCTYCVPLVNLTFRLKGRRVVVSARAR